MNDSFECVLIACMTIIAMEIDYKWIYFWIFTHFKILKMSHPIPYVLKWRWKRKNTHEKNNDVDDERTEQWHKQQIHEHAQKWIVYEKCV